jgi:hypothetical protein
MLWVSNLPVQTFWSLDEGGKFIYLQSVPQTGDIQTALVYPGSQIDPGQSFPPLFFYIHQDNQLFTWWPVWFPLLSLPFYQLLGWYGLFILPAAGGALSVLLSGKIMRLVYPHKERLAYAAAALTGLATPIAFYSTRYWEHTPACALFLLSTWLLLKGLPGKQPKTWLILSGLTGAAAAWLRLDILPILFGYGLCLLWLRRRQALIWGASFSIPFLSALGLNNLISGNIFGPTYISIQSLKIGNLFSNIIQTIAHILFNTPAIGAYPLPSWMLFTGVLALVIGFLLAFLPRFRFAALAFNLWVIAISAWVLSQGYDYRSVHGFVLISPLVLFASWLGAFPPLWKKNIFYILAASGIATFGLIFLLRGWYAAGGLQYGPRYLLSLYPLLIIIGLAAYDQVTTHFRLPLQLAWRVAFITAILVSMAYQAAGLYNTYQTLSFYQTSGEHFPPQNLGPFFTRCTWLSMVLPELYWRGDLFAGDQTAWEAHLRSQGIPQFTEVDMLSCNTEPLRKVKKLYSQTPGGLTSNQVRLE